MQNIIFSFLIVHIIAGYLAFISAPLALLFKKGGKRHKLSGNIFYYAMLVAVISAFVISAAKQNAFLFHISIFSFYMNYTGRRSIRNKSLRPGSWDILFLVIAFVNGIFMICSGNLVLVIFGSLNSFFALSDCRLFYLVKKTKPLHPFLWLFRHIGRMIGAYIAATTAFLVVNTDAGIPWLPWLLPAAVGTPLITYYIYSAKRNPAAIFRFLIPFLSIFYALAGEAQPYIKAKTRHRFAQLTLGTDAKMHSSYGTEATVIQNGTLQTIGLGNSIQSRMIIGGTHFWGHADFYIAIPVANYGKQAFYSSVETGFRYMPWRIQCNKLRPFAGISHLPTVYKQGGGTKAVRFRYPLQAGLIFNYKKHLVELSAGYIHQHKMDYFIDRLQAVTIHTPSYSFTVGYKLMLETTASGESYWLNGSIQRYTDSLAAKKKLNSITIAAGPSVAFFLKPSGHNPTVKPFLDNHKSTGIFADLGVGYYMHTPDLQINLAYRSCKNTLAAYGISQVAKRRSIALEVYKFFADYHGFCPFIGPAVSLEHLVVEETGDASENASFKGIKAGITCGWDIRPNRILAWYLRTNIRYFPNLNVTMKDGLSIPFDQLEVNFIQLVVLPGRI